jgi:hypothetical protein
MAKPLPYSIWITDRDLLGDWFQPPESWTAWRSIDKAIFGEPMTADELATYRQLTNRTDPPAGPVREAWLAMGRRSGKSLKAASYAVFVAVEGDRRHSYRRFLVPGESAVVQIIAVDKEQAGIVFGYLDAMFTEKPALAKLLAKAPTAQTIELRSGISIEVMANDRRRVRGRTVIAAIFEEVAHWLPSERSTNPDVEVYRAVRPAMLNIPAALLVGISSPHARSGLFWSKYRASFGKDGPVLVATAPTLTMNPSADRAEIEAAYAEDEEWAKAEFGAQFRSDLEPFVTREVVASCTTTGIVERPPIRGTHYTAFVDPSGGSNDSFTAAIAHSETDPATRVTSAILDAVFEARPPFSPAQVAGDIANLLRSYRITTATSDRYAGQFPAELFRQNGIALRHSEKPKSDIYRELLPLLRSERADLLDIPRLHAQLVALERRVARGGRESIDHPAHPGARDDLANAAAGALTLAAGTMRRGRVGVLWSDAPPASRLHGEAV